ncbi:hypothetical protein ILYODFUR_016423 [Ilyodon furcidens]|uniref:Uncharacterized protein n=1 Tax=Ilyodon furcidens TaxID=33524 RepID=A0ABV0SND8_9TELE
MCTEEESGGHLPLYFGCHRWVGGQLHHAWEQPLLKVANTDKNGSSGVQTLTRDSADNRVDTDEKQVNINWSNSIKYNSSTSWTVIRAYSLQANLSKAGPHCL